MFRTPDDFHTISDMRKWFLSFSRRKSRIDNYLQRCSNDVGLVLEDLSSGAPILSSFGDGDRDRAFLLKCNEAFEKLTAAMEVDDEQGLKATEVDEVFSSKFRKDSNQLKWIRSVIEDNNRKRAFLDSLEKDPYDTLYANTINVWPKPEELRDRPPFKFTDADLVYVGLCQQDCNNPFRVEYAVYDVVHSAAASGDRHSYMTEPEVIFKLRAPPYNIMDVGLIRQSILGGRLVVRDEKNRYVMSSVDRAERDIASILRMIHRHRSDSVVEHIDERDPDQQEAIRCSVAGGVVIVRGPPGTGKTQVAIKIKDIIQRQHGKVLVCLDNDADDLRVVDSVIQAAAPTGVAAKNIQKRMKNVPASTLHRIILSTSYRAKVLSNLDTVIVDELSMVDVMTFASFLRIVGPRIRRLVLLGDPSQLPSVSHGRVLADLVDTWIPCVELTTNHRSGNMAQVTEMLRQLDKHGEIPRSIPDTLDVVDIEELLDTGTCTASSARTLKMILNTLRKFTALGLNVQCIASQHNVRVVLLSLIQAESFPDIPRDLHVDADMLLHKSGDETIKVRIVDKRVIRGFEAEEDDYFKYEYLVKEMYNPGVTPHWVERWKLSFRDLLIDERVMLTSNEGNYVNGDMGTVTGFRVADRHGTGKREVKFRIQIAGGKEVEAPLCDVDTAHAITVHKYQGKESEAIILVIGKFCNKAMLYTGISRFKTRCALFAVASLLKKSARWPAPRRNTRLYEIVQSS
jgi:hypothetical protein